MAYTWEQRECDPLDVPPALKVVDNPTENGTGWEWLKMNQ